MQSNNYLLKQKYKKKNRQMSQLQSQWVIALISLLLQPVQQVLLILHGLKMH